MLARSTQALALLLAPAALAAAASACASDPHGGPTGPVTDATVTIAPEIKLLAAPTTEPQELPGIDTSELTKRERTAYWRWVSQLYAPCTDIAVSVADCVKDARPCAACVPAAQFLAGRARAGASQNEGIAAFHARFGADVKKVDLADSPARGPADAPVTIIVWSDYECPACGYAVPFIDEARDKHANDVRLVHKLYPLKSHPHSRPASRAALAAKKQGKYWEMEKLLFKNQKSLEDADLEGYARDVGLDMAKFKRDFADPLADEIIDRDRAEAEKHGLSGTPFILINGREFDLAFFKLDRDLDAWITSEIEIRRKDAELRAAATAIPAATPTALATASAPATAVPAAPTAEPTATPVATAAPRPKN